MGPKRTALVLFVFSLTLGFSSLSFAELTEKDQLGKILYFDEYLSLNHNQSCASCHLPPGFADPVNAGDPVNLPVSEGSISGLFGGRNSPTSSYAAASPHFNYRPRMGYVGGQFWDGRAPNLKEQAKGPFLNPVEMAMPSEAAVVGAVASLENPNYPDYLNLFQQAFKVNLDAIDLNDELLVKTVYNQIAGAIANYERTSELNKFNSRYDAYLAGAATLTETELAGLDLFNGNCSQCHPSDGTSKAGKILMPTVFSNHSYHNLGLPHSENPLLADNPPDLGLGGRVDISDPREYGKFKVPTLRNIELTAPYGHNGYFATLEEMVHFLNSRDAEAWAAPEVDQNLTAEIGQLSLSPAEETAIVTFLKTLTDGGEN